MVDYFVVGPYREILLTLELVIIFITLEISIYFYNKYLYNRKNSIPSVVELDWGILFGSFAITFAAYLYADFFASYRDLFIVIGYFMLGFGAFLFFYHIESSKTKKPKFIFTPLFGCIPIILVVLFLIAPSIMQSVAMPIILLAYVVLIAYFLMIVKRIWSVYKLYSIGFLFGIVLWFIGFMCTSDLAITLLQGFHVRVIGDIAIISGMGLIGFFLNSIPSLAEIGWQKKIKYVILTAHSGVCLYHENFQEKQPIREVLLAGALAGLNIFVGTVMKGNEKLRVISKGHDIFLLHEGNYITGILVVEQELEILKYLLDKLVTQFEDFYQNILSNWKRDIEVFKPTEHLINSIFSIRKI